MEIILLTKNCRLFFLTFMISGEHSLRVASEYAVRLRLGQRFRGRNTQHSLPCIRLPTNITFAWRGSFRRHHAPCEAHFKTQSSRDATTNVIYCHLCDRMCNPKIASPTHNIHATSIMGSFVWRSGDFTDLFFQTYSLKSLQKLLLVYPFWRLPLKGPRGSIPETWLQYNHSDTMHLNWRSSVFFVTLLSMIHEEGISCPHLLCPIPAVDKLCQHLDCLKSCQNHMHVEHTLMYTSERFTSIFF